MKLQVDPNSPSGFRLTRGDKREHTEAGDPRLRRSRNVPPVGAEPRVDETDPTPELPPLPGQADPATIKVGTMRGEMTDDGRANAYVWSGVSWELVASNQIVESEALDIVQWHPDQNYEPGQIVLYLDTATDSYTMWQAIDRGYEGTGPPAEPGWLPIGGSSSGGGGTDEVWIGPTAPVDPAIELWVDSDAPTPGVSIPAGMPRGIIGSVAQAGADINLTTAGWQDIPGMSITFTPTGADRTYRMTFSGTINIPSVGGTQIMGIHDGTSQFVCQEIQTAGATPMSHPFCVVATVKITAVVPRTFKAQVYNNGGAPKLMGAGGRNARFIIDDIGGV